MTTRKPSPDSYKSPIVLMAIGDPRLLDRPLTNIGAENMFRAFANSAAAVLYKDVVPHQYIESFDLSMETESFLHVTFTLFDPEVDTLYSYFSTARASNAFSNTDGIPTELRTYSVFFQWGWLVDGRTPLLSSVREAKIITIRPSLTQAGMRLVIECVQSRTFEKTAGKISASFELPARPEVIARAILENTKPQKAISGQPLPTKHFSRSDLDAIAARISSGSGVRLEIDTPCLPITKEVNNGNDAVVCTPLESPVRFITTKLLRVARPESSAFQGMPIHFYEDESSPGLFRWGTLAVRGTSGNLTEVVREYNFGRGINSDMLEFEPEESQVWAEQLGAMAMYSFVNPRRVPGDQTSQLVFGEIYQTSQDVPSTVASMIRKYEISKARTLDAQSYSARVLWNKSQQLVYQAQATVLGDPLIRLMDRVRVNYYAGGLAHQQDSAIRLVPFISGSYVVLGYRHTISAGNFTTHLMLTNSRGAPESSESPESELASIIKPISLLE